MKEPSVDLALNVHNQSDRQGATPKIIVLHSTESGDVRGLSDLSGIGSWFNNPAAEASAHVGVDAEGNSARYVPDGRKAWACSGFNRPSLNLEMVGRASWFLARWTGRRRQLEEVARWLAYWSAKHHIPLEWGKVDRAAGIILKPGIVRHMDLGAIGGNHHDPGRFFPTSRVIRRARKIKRGAR